MEKFTEMPVMGHQPNIVVQGSQIGEDLKIITVIPPKSPLSLEEIKVLIRFWNVPILPDHFIGRVELLHALQSITKLAITTCHVLGGIGKTCLAAKYVHDHQNDYDFVLWMPVEKTEVLYQAYYNFARALQLTVE